MYKNFSLTQNIQIPLENVYVTEPGVKKLDDEIEKLSDNYDIHKQGEIKNFIMNNEGLFSYINKITPLINYYFPNYKKCIIFCPDPEFDELDDLTIYINSSKAEFEKELFYIEEFSSEIKGLISVDLWLV